jgi:hypothetical protein
VILFQFQNAPNTIAASAFVERLFFGNATHQDGASQVYQKYTNQRIEFTGLAVGSQKPDIFGWITLPYADSGPCNPENWKSDARTISGFPYVNSYDRVIYISNTSPTCPYGGYADLPGKESIAFNDYPGKFNSKF